MVRRGKSYKDIQTNNQKEKDKKDKQKSTKCYTKRLSNTNPTKTQGELMCSGRVGGSAVLTHVHAGQLPGRPRV